MAFWKGETLLARLPALIGPKDAFDEKRIDCAAYTLRLGSDVFVTSDLPDVGGPQEGVKTTLTSGQQIRINPGQFAFLRTEEVVDVPNDALAFISMKATFKMRGLINVSGFHVDPGWKGALLFAVYNAGPSPVVLERGMALFLIWFADLDGATSHTYKGSGKSIDATLISNMSGQVFSPIGLQKEVQRLRDKFSESHETVIRVDSSIKSISTIAFRVGLTVIVIAVSAIGFLFTQLHDAKLEIAALKALAQQSQLRSLAAPESVKSSSGDAGAKKPQATKSKP